MKKTRWNHGATFEIQVAFPRKSPNGNGNGRRGPWVERDSFGRLALPHDRQEMRPPLGLRSEKGGYLMNPDSLFMHISPTETKELTRRSLIF